MRITKFEIWTGGLSLVLVGGLLAAFAHSSSKSPSVAASGSSSSAAASSHHSRPATTGAPPTTGAAPSISATSFNNSYSAMKQLVTLAKHGKGKVAAILPDTVSSTRYVEFDAPDLKKAMATAGLPASDIIVQNALGSDSTQLTDAETDITNGATVLLVDPLDSGVGAQIENYAKSHGVVRDRLRPAHARR